MIRRDVLKAAGASLAALAAPRIGRAERPNKLVFVPPIDLTVLDPIVTALRSTRNHAYLVFDTLYGIDTNWTAQPQMVEGHQVDEDGLTWTLTLRDGLRFHDKEPVLARDVVASIRRFAARIGFVDALMAATEELSAPDDRTVRFTAGPKVAHFDRVEWLTLDPFSAMAALRAGEVDWWEVQPRDLAEGLARERDITVISQYATALALLRFNHLHPPFDNAAVRRALLGAVDQAEAMIAIAGTDHAFWHDGIGLFPAGTPFANDAGIEVLRGPRDYPAVQQALE